MYAVLIGFVTPLAAFAAALSSFVLAPSGLPQSAPAIVASAVTPIFLTADAVSLVMLGPGALSIDARLFGRREVIIPHDSWATRTELENSSSRFLIWRRGRESNPRMAVLQTAALPLRHRAPGVQTKSAESLRLAFEPASIRVSAFSRTRFGRAQRNGRRPLRSNNTRAGFISV
jgi:hypothetical protein